MASLTLRVEMCGDLQPAEKTRHLPAGVRILPWPHRHIRWDRRLAQSARASPRRAIGPVGRRRTVGRARAGWRTAEVRLQGAARGRTGRARRGRGGRRAADRRAGLAVVGRRRRLAPATTSCRAAGQNDQDDDCKSLHRPLLCVCPDGRPLPCRNPERGEA